MIETAPVIAAVIIVILVGTLWKAALGLPFGPSYSAHQKTEAEKLICKYLDTTNECLYPSEIAERLHIDYDLCMECVEKLYREGKIKILSDEEKDIYDKKGIYES